MAVSGETELHQEIERLRGEMEGLRVELARREREATDKERQLEKYAADLRETFKQERARSQELHRSYMATVTALSNAVERRDHYTGKHAERVAAYGMVIVRALPVPLAESSATEFGFLLHDIGKVAVPDAILHKEGRLTAEERAVMETHPTVGHEMVAGIDFLGDAALVILHHHERWDGAGYPARLAGENIPLAARVFSVADVLDALTTDRPYRPASPFSVGREMITADSGSHFDPDVIEVFNTIDDATFERIGAEIR